MADRTNNSQFAATGAQFVKTVASAGTPEALTATETLVEAVEIEAKKGRNTNNAAVIYIGFTPANDSQLKAISPGNTYNFSAPVG